MKIMHRFGITIPPGTDRQAFSDLSIDLERGGVNLHGSYFTNFEIAEDDPPWVEARQLANKFKPTELVTTKFSKSELDAARVLYMLASTQRGYPEPSEDFGFLKATYDLSDYCAKCGLGARQIHPFRIRFTPNLKRTIMQLNWVFDEFFVARDVWASTFEPFGIDNWPVVSGKNRSEIESVVQLRITRQADLELEDAGRTNCSRCGRRKNLVSFRGFAPLPVSIPGPIFKSTQYFGTGAEAFNRVYVSASLYREIKRRCLRGIQFYPCASTSR